MLSYIIWITTKIMANKPKRDKAIYDKQYRIDNKEKTKERMKLYYISIRDKQKQYAKKYYNANKEAIKKQTKQYKLNNKDKLKEISKQYYIDNIQHFKEYHKNNKDRINKYVHNRRKNNIEFKLRLNLSSRIYNVLRGVDKLKSTIKLLGCSIEDFKIWIEKQFTEGMTWNNYGINGWELDHVYPVSKFNLEHHMNKR